MNQADLKSKKFHFGKSIQDLFTLEELGLLPSIVVEEDSFLRSLNYYISSARGASSRLSTS